MTYTENALNGEWARCFENRRMRAPRPARDPEHIRDVLRRLMPRLQRRELKDGVPCRHPGCRHHFSHPCEVCGRIGMRRKEADHDA